MRTSLFFAALLIAPVALAQETTSAQGGGGDPNQPVQVQPVLHRHPILMAMFRRSNDIRRGVSLRGHRMNPALTQAAQDQANYMAQTGQFSHYVNGGYQYRANKYGFRGGVLENIAMGTTSVEGAFGMWHASGGHYAAIVSGTTEAGFGYAVSASGTPYWVGVYGNPAEGDEIGSTEDEVAKYQEELQRKEAEKNPAQEQNSQAPPAPGNGASNTPADSQGQGNPAGTNQPGGATPPRVQSPMM